AGVRRKSKGGRGQTGGEIESRGARIMSILVVMEQRGGEWNRMSWETLAAAQQLANQMSTTASAAVLGQSIDALTSELAGRQLAKVHAVEHELLKEYTPDAHTSALRQLIAQS